MNKDDIRKCGNGTITDPELIREISKSGDLELISKVKPGYEFLGLYPYKMKRYNILPEGSNDPILSKLLKKIEEEIKNLSKKRSGK